MAAGATHSLALGFNGTVTAFGSDNYGQRSVPPGLTNIVAIAAGERHSLALKDNGVIVAWGNNSFSQTSVPSPNTSFIVIAAGFRHSLGVKTDSTVVAWGDYTCGATAVPSGLNNVIAVAGGTCHSLALKANGAIVAWGDNSQGQCSPLPGYADFVEIAAGWTHNLGLRANGTVFAWGDTTGGATTVPSGLNNVIHIAAGNHFSVALKSDGSLVAWGDNSAGQSTLPDGLGKIQTIAAGQRHALALPYTPTLDYPVDTRRDLLIVYNTAHPDSVAMKNYYLAHRPRIGTPNLLGVALSSTYDEGMSSALYVNNFYSGISNWFRLNLAKHPSHILLMYGVPNSAAPTSYSLQHMLRADLESHFGYRPIVSALNLRNTNDCVHYINKLENVGNNCPAISPTLSSDRAGVARNLFVLDNARPGIPYANDHTITIMPNRLAAVGVLAGQIYYTDNLGVGNPSTYAVTSATDIASFLSWGAYKGLGDDWATNGSVKLHGNSSWYLSEHIESLNGSWNPHVLNPDVNQHSYLDWFGEFALGGTGWANTPVVATSTVNEPTVPGLSQPEGNLVLWSIGRTAARAFWYAMSPNPPSLSTKFSAWEMQVTGDPFIRK